MYIYATYKLFLEAEIMQAAATAKPINAKQQHLVVHAAKQQITADNKAKKGGKNTAPDVQASQQAPQRGAPDPTVLPKIHRA